MHVLLQSFKVIMEEVDWSGTPIVMYLHRLSQINVKAERNHMWICYNKAILVQA
jgi:hypothetical protein